MTCHCDYGRSCGCGRGRSSWSCCRGGHGGGCGRGRVTSGGRHLRDRGDRGHDGGGGDRLPGGGLRVEDWIARGISGKG